MYAVAAVGSSMVAAHTVGAVTGQTSEAVTGQTEDAAGHTDVAVTPWVDLGDHLNNMVQEGCAAWPIGNCGG